MAAEGIYTFTDGNFDADVLKSKEPVLVDFWAAWCAPCRAISPVVDQLAKEYSGKIRVGKVNVDENPQVPTQYHITSIPALLVFKEGKVIGEIRGAVPKPKIEELLKKAL
jgi:thioredoxin 1